MTDQIEEGREAHCVDLMERSKALNDRLIILNAMNEAIGIRAEAAAERGREAMDASDQLNDKMETTQRDMEDLDVQKEGLA